MPSCPHTKNRDLCIDAQCASNHAEWILSELSPQDSVSIAIWSKEAKRRARVARIHRDILGGCAHGIRGTCSNRKCMNQLREQEFAYFRSRQSGRPVTYNICPVCAQSTRARCTSTST